MKDFLNQDLSLRDTVVVIDPHAEFVIGTILDFKNTGKTQMATVFYRSNGKNVKEDFCSSEMVKRVSDMKFERVSIKNDGDGHGFVIPRREEAEFDADLEYADKHDDYVVFEEKYDQYKVEDLNNVKIYANFLGELIDVS